MRAAAARASTWGSARRPAFARLSSAGRTARANTCPRPSIGSPPFGKATDDEDGGVHRGRRGTRRGGAVASPASAGGGRHTGAAPQSGQGLLRESNDVQGSGRGVSQGAGAGAGVRVR